MRENEFERRVQEQMEELHLRPSESVWTKVEKELHEKKRRRFAFYIILLAGLALAGYVGYTLLNSGSTSSLTNHKPAAAPRYESPSGSDAPLTGGNTTPVINDNNTAQSGSAAAQSPVGINKENGAGTGQKDIDRKGSTVIPGRKSQPEESRAIPNSNEIAALSGPRKKAVPDNAPKPEKSGVQDEGLIKNDNDKDKKSTVQNGLIRPDTTVVVAGATGKDSIVKATVKENPEQVITAATKSVPKINWGLDLSGGILVARNRPLTLERAPLLASLNFSNPNPVMANPGGGGGGGVGSGSIRPPSAVRSGPSFKIGAVAEMELPEKRSVSAGLRYVYLSEKIRVGTYQVRPFMTSTYQRTATNIVAAYRGNSRKTFTNKYHFIELPLSYHLQLNKGLKLPILWNVGVTPGYLVTSNALVYDTAAGGVYYRDSDAFSKFHISLHTGLSFRFGRKSGVQWLLGPEISLDMKSLTGDDVFIKKRYLMYGGIGARLFFAPPKK